MQDQISRNCFERPTHASLRIEAGSKSRLREIVAQMRRDAAGDENAALGIEAECKVAGKLAEERAKSIECSAARRAAAGDTRPCDRCSATFQNGP